MDNAGSKPPSLVNAVVQLAISPAMLLATVLGFCCGCIRLAFKDGNWAAEKMAARASLRKGQGG